MKKFNWNGTLSKPESVQSILGRVEAAGYAISRTFIPEDVRDPDLGCAVLKYMTEYTATPSKDSKVRFSRRNDPPVRPAKKQAPWVEKMNFSYEPDTWDFFLEKEEPGIHEMKRRKVEDDTEMLFMPLKFHFYYSKSARAARNPTLDIVL